MKTALSLLAALLLLTACRSVHLHESYDGHTLETWRWQSGLVGALQSDIVSHRPDGSCLRITWNKVSQVLIDVRTEVRSEKPCKQ